MTDAQRASKHFVLLARLGKLPCHQKLDIFKFMFSLSDNFFIVHVLYLIQILFFVSQS
jgi:hypothetical protein